MFSQVSVDDCARREFQNYFKKKHKTSKLMKIYINIECNELLGAECKTFDFCYLSGDCRLSVQYIENANSTLTPIQADNCDIYESIYTN